MANRLGTMPARQLRELKHWEAVARNAKTPHRRTRAHREYRCDCTPPSSKGARR